jgi:hypothetical protein
MTSSSTLNVVIVVVVIAGDCDGDPVSPIPTDTRPAEARTRQEHAQAGSHPPGTPGDDTE